MARMPTTTKQGQRAETIAANYLTAQGLIKVDQNCRYKCGELDLVMLDNCSHKPTLIFVEVRYRKNFNFGGAVASITPSKIHKLSKAANCYLIENPQYASVQCRFDLIAIHGLLTAPQINWLKHIIEA